MHDYKDPVHFSARHDGSLSIYEGSREVANLKGVGLMALFGEILKALKAERGAAE